MEPIALSDDELGAVLAAARPIPVDRRDSFLKAVTDALAGQSPIGPGTVHRAIAAAQRQFLIRRSSMARTAAARAGAPHHRNTGDAYYTESLKT
jgi:hypothetical protein